MHQRIAILLNPNSGSVRDGAEIREAIQQHLPSARVFESSEKGDLEWIAARLQSDGVDAVIAAGGDGTLHDVVNGCMRGGAKTRLGLIPLGTGNDFARSLSLPVDIAAACEVIREGVIRKIDVVRVTTPEPRFMINVAAGGFAGVVSEKLTPEVKAAWGPLSYVRGMIDALGEMQTYRATIRVDGGDVEEIPLLNVVVANGNHVARGIPIAPEADPSDGLVDVVVVRDMTLPALAMLAPQILVAAHLDNAEVLHIRARRFSIESNPPMIFNADGEVLGDHPATFEVLPQAISFLAPALSNRTDSKAEASSS